MSGSCLYCIDCGCWEGQGDGGGHETGWLSPTGVLSLMYRITSFTVRVCDLSVRWPTLDFYSSALLCPLSAVTQKICIKPICDPKYILEAWKTKSMHVSGPGTWEAFNKRQLRHSKLLHLSANGHVWAFLMHWSSVGLLTSIVAQTGALHPPTATKYSSRNQISDQTWALFSVKFSN